MNDIDSRTLLEMAETLATIKELFASSEPLLPIYTALGGAFVGAVSGIIPTTISNIIKGRKKKKSVTLAIYSEIKANLELYEHRQYLKHFKSIIEHLERNEGLTYSLKIGVSDNRFLVYKSQLENLGSLDSNIAVLVVRFYQLLEAIIQDIKPGGSLNTDDHGIDSYKQLLAISEQAYEVGHKALNAIEIKYITNAKSA